MPVVAEGMAITGIVALLAGLILIRTRFAAASGIDKLLILGPLCEAIALAIFAAEHLFAGPALATIVPHWLPAPLFWTYFVGVCLLATAISLLAFRYVRWSASLLALLFLIIVTTMDLPNLSKQLHERLFWTLTVRETAFACGAILLAATQWPRAHRVRAIVSNIARFALAAIFVFYAIEHFLFPHNVPGVPLEKMTPAWMPAPVLISWFTGLTLLVAGPGLLFHRTRRQAAALAGAVLLLLTVFFYGPILLTELHAPLVVEGLNYVGDTLLFAATALLAGFGDAAEPRESLPV